MYDIAIITPPSYQNNSNILKKRFPFASIYSGYSNQLNLIKQIVLNAKTKYIWILSAHIDYSKFDFHWRPKQDQEHQIHAWSTEDGNYDTFLIPVYDFKKQIDIKFLTSYVYVNWHNENLKIIDNLKLNNLDIFFLSNGESCTKQNLENLIDSSNLPVIWVKNVDSRTKALHDAAKLSTTNWFFVVPAKLQVNKKFNWFWKPVWPDDEFYKNKDYNEFYYHYIFTATNCLNNLEYGHMALVAYNKELVLKTTTPGLDFTLSQPHKILNVNSGVATFNLDPLTTWRTAFREVLKLKYYNTNNFTNETDLRLNTWTHHATGNNAEWCIRGALDALDYFSSVNGDYNKIMLSYHWQWVEAYAKQKGYNLWN